jgi:hypothetical protein
LKTPSEAILLLDLLTEEKSLINGLISSFELEAVDLSAASIGRFVQQFPEKKICLIVFRIDESLKHQDRVIRRVRDVVGGQVLFLVLVPQKNRGEIPRYLKAGADDYMTLPLDEERFSIGFLILLELGQAMVHFEKADEPPPDSEKSGRHPHGRDGMIDFLHKELSSFSPKRLIQRFGSGNISHRWAPVKKLGQGGFGVVWLVKEIGTGRPAVAKVPHSSKMNSRILRSAAILKRLVHHPNIVHLIEIARDSGKLILIQEYVDGSTLQQLLEDGIGSRDKETYFLQLLSAIAFAHRHRILHRDIKPENILISKTGQLKLLDFGIAQDLSWQRPSKRSEGTVNFMPPEQFQGKSCIASDVWALGVLLYIFAANAVPYVQPNDSYPADTQINLDIMTPRKINPDITVELEKIIMGCLEKNLLKRYQDATQVQDALRAAFPRFGRGEVIPG